MKDKASADTQRTEAVNCTVEITGGEKRERGGGGLKGDRDRKREKNVRADKRRGGNEKREREKTEAYAILNRMLEFYIYVCASS